MTIVGERQEGYGKEAFKKNSLSSFTSCGFKDVLGVISRKTDTIWRHNESDFLVIHYNF